MGRYDHGGDIYANTGVKLDFSVNINPLGLPDSVRQALISRVDEFSQYPDPHCRKLSGAISCQEQVPLEWIVCGNGAADLIYRLCYAIKPRKALVCAPTFSEYERALQQVDCQVVYHHLTAENQFALTERIIEQLRPDIDLLFLCNPNNPTGQLIPRDLLQEILAVTKKNGCIVIVDECFLDFTDGVSVKGYLKDMPGLVILKAFTKMYAMAGLRLGYLLAADKTLLEKVRCGAQCWSVSMPAQIAGITALSLTGWQEKTRKMVVKERQYLSEALQKLGITVFPSSANFILFCWEGALYEPLLQKGILIRSCKNYIGLGEAYYRIGVKTRAENSLLIESIKETLHG